MREASNLEVMEAARALEESWERQHREEADKRHLLYDVAQKRLFLAETLIDEGHFESARSHMLSARQSIGEPDGDQYTSKHRIETITFYNSLTNLLEVGGI